MKWPWSPTESADLTVPVNEAFHLLSSERRLEAIRFLATMDGDEIDLNELTEFVTLSVDGKDPAVKADVKAVYTTLYQNHLPKLERAGLISLERGTEITCEEGLEAMHDLIVEASERRPATSPTDDIETQDVTICGQAAGSVN